MVGVFWKQWDRLTSRLHGASYYLPPLALRLILAWEFYEAGIEKYHGSNWFSSIQSKFPFPFDIIPASISWGMATWFEIIGGLAIALGLLTRFFAFSLMVLTVVATAAVHWPAEWSSLGALWQGYAISDKGFGNFKLPLLFFIMYLPLFFGGPGKLSLDHLLTKLFRPSAADGTAVADLYTVGWTLLAVGVPLVFILPWFGGGLAIVGGLLVVLKRLSQR